MIVLASSSMDKPLAYVAMSRHRDEVKVFVPQSEIADLKALTWSFSRTSPKLTTLDYAELRGVGAKPVIPLELSPLVQAGRAVVDAARQAFEAVKAKFEAVVVAVQTRLAPVAAVAMPVLVPVLVPAVAAQPTGTAPGPAVERAAPPVVVTPSLADKPAEAAVVTDTAKSVPPKRATSMFAGVKLNAGAAAPKAAPAPKGTAPTPLSHAVERWAVADRAIVHVAALGLPPAAAQANALAAAKSALDAIRPGAVAALQSALKHDPAAGTALTGSTGNQRGAALVACLDREQAAVQNPNVRAARHVASWHAAVTSHVAAREAGGSKLIEAAKVDLRDAAKAIASDPHAVAVMRDQAAELGIREGSTLAAALKTPDVGKALTAVIDPPALGWSR